MSDSPVSICNLALDRCGQETISNIESPTTEAEQLMARWYDVSRRKLLAEYVWNFAKKRETLARQTTAPLFDFADAYKLPNDYISLLTVGGENEYYRTMEYDIQDNLIYMNNGGSNALNIRYIADVTTVSKFSTLFKHLLSLELAVKVAYRFSLQKTLTEALAKELAQETVKAVTIDSRERPPIRIERSRILSRRRGSLSGTTQGGRYVVFDV